MQRTVNPYKVGSTPTLRTMTQEEKIRLITRNCEEVVTEEDLKSFLSNDVPLKHYIGFEISGKIHLGTGLMCMGKIKDFMDAGIECSVFLADWHSWINDKLGGNREVIKNIAVRYFKEGLKASLKCLGGNPDKLKFVLGSELYHNNDDYWATVIEVSKNTTLSRIKRSLDILGRQEEEGVDFAKLIYPPMQVADIFIQGLTIAHAGMDQRKAHVVMRDVALRLKVNPVRDNNGKIVKPVAIHHHLLLGLQKPAIWPIPKESLQSIWTKAKMSKSIPKSAVFVHDSPDEIKSKIMSAFCPEKEVGFNPVLDWTKFLIFNRDKVELIIDRPAKFGGTIIYKTFEDLQNDFGNGVLHPQDLKVAVAKTIIELLEPARKHFEIPENKIMIQEMESLLVTR